MTVLKFKNYLKNTKKKKVITIIKTEDTFVCNTCGCKIGSEDCVVVNSVNGTTSYVCDTCLSYKVNYFCKFGSEDYIGRRITKEVGKAKIGYRFKSKDGYNCVVVGFTRNEMGKEQTQYREVKCTDTNEINYHVLKKEIELDNYYCKYENKRRDKFIGTEYKLLGLDLKVEEYYYNEDPGRVLCDVSLITGDMLKKVPFRSIVYGKVSKVMLKQLLNLHNEGKITLDLSLLGRFIPVCARVGKVYPLLDGTTAEIIEASSFYEVKVKVRETGEMVDTSILLLERGRLRSTIKRNKTESIRSVTKLHINDVYVNTAGQLCRILEVGTGQSLVEFEDGESNKVKNHQILSGNIPNNSFKLQGIGVYKGAHVGVVQVERIEYKLTNARDVNYSCTCSVCGMRDIMTPTEMLKHECNSSLYNSLDSFWKEIL